MNRRWDSATRKEQLWLTQLRLLLLPLLLCLSFSLSAKHTPLEILVLHSYSTDYRWTNEANEGIFKVLRQADPDALIRVEYMDTKNIYSAEYLDYLVQLYRYKYENDQPDGIILTDNNAMEFFLAHGKELFPQVPAIASGINSAAAPAAEGQLKSVIAELAEHEQTLQRAQQLFPNAKEIYILSDATPTGQLLGEEAKQAFRPYEGFLSIHHLSGLDAEQLVKLVAPLGQEAVIYLLPYFRAGNGETYSQGQMEHLLSEQTQAPVMVSWAFQMGTGALGGEVISSKQMGQQAAQSMLQLLNDESLTSFQTHLKVSDSLYDYQVAEKIGLNPLQFPSHTQWLNRPDSFYQEHKEAVLPALLVIVILAVISFLLLLTLKKQRALNINNHRLMALDKEVIETQRELVTTLGEVIEVRSNETHNHVLRVSKICRLLGEKVGLPRHELDLLEAASSLHDVGKIGVSETILHKPGELTTEEREQMKTHTRIGRDILGNSDRPLIKMCRNIAYQHHEHWDGSGYPNGIAGEAISIHARITTLADVYDAFSSHRSYKDAWPEAKVLETIQKNRGIIFEPRLVDLFMEHLSEIKAIRLAHL